jgi:hypothetical protein
VTNLNSWQNIETAPDAEYVLVNIDISGTFFTNIGKNIDGKWHTIDGSIWLPGFVTHWMSLPSPPNSPKNY